MQEHFSLKMGYVCYSSAFLNVKNVAQHLWNTDYVICLVFCFAACLPATILHDSLRAKFLA